MLCLLAWKMEDNVKLPSPDREHFLCSTMWVLFSIEVKVKWYYPLFNIALLFKYLAHNYNVFVYKSRLFCTSVTECRKQEKLHAKYPFKYSFYQQNRTWYGKIPTLFVVFKKKVNNGFIATKWTKTYFHLTLYVQMDFLICSSTNGWRNGYFSDICTK